MFTSAVQIRASDSSQPSFHRADLIRSTINYCFSVRLNMSLEEDL
ncbi:hypothetical protein DSUL_20047 [Desulfovibrionales bacterium]